MRRNIKEANFLLSDFFWGGSGASLPSTNSTKNKILESGHEILCPSFLNGHGLRGTNMNPGQVYFLTHFIIEPPKEDIYMGELFCPYY